MHLEMRASLGSGYRSPTQIARVVTEDWATRNLYCPACESNVLDPTAPNSPAIDLSCPSCGQVFQLKSGRNWGQRKVVDAGFAAMIAAIRSDRVPNLVLMQYTESWKVHNLLIVPHFFFTESVIEKRKPLGPDARRAGWVGCNILIGEIPIDGKLRVVEDGTIAESAQVRRHFNNVRSLSSVGTEVRGWTLDVLRAIRKLGKSEFTLSEVYTFDSLLKEAHPDNQNIRPKIRQQLQKLRDLKILKFVSPGRYRLADI